MIMTSMVSQSRLMREKILDEIRDHLNFLHGNGGTDLYSYEKIAEIINGICGTKFHKSDARKFILGEHRFSSSSAEVVAQLLIETRQARVRVESVLSKAFNSVVVGKSRRVRQIKKATRSASHAPKQG